MKDNASFLSDVLNHKMTIEIDTGVAGDRSDNTTYQHVPTSNPAGWHIPSRDGSAMREPKRPVLAHGKVRHVGDAFAVVVAETREQARDAAAAIVSDITELPAIVSTRKLIHHSAATGISCPASHRTLPAAGMQRAQGLPDPCVAFDRLTNGGCQRGHYGAAL